MVSDPDLDVSGLPAQSRRLASELDAIVVLLLPSAADGSLRVGVSVPDALTGSSPATAVLDQVLSVTGGRGGGSPSFAQGGGAAAADLDQTIARIGDTLGLEP